MIRAGLVALALLAIGGYLVAAQPQTATAVAVALPASFAMMLLHGWRLRMLSASRIDLATAVKGLGVAITGNYVLPMRLAEFLKPAYFARRSTVPFPDGLSIVVVERVFDILLLAAFASVALIAWQPANAGMLQRLDTVVGVGTIALLVAGIVLARHAPGAISAGIRLLPGGLAALGTRLFELFREALALGLTPSQVLVGFATWVNSWLVFWVFCQFDGGVALAPGEAFVVFLAATLGMAIPAIPGGLGLFEGAILLTLVPMGYALHEAIATAVGLRLVCTLPSVLIAGYVLLVEGRELFEVPERWRRRRG